jgi:hypothetical protein
MPYLDPQFWRFNVFTQQYQQTNTWFLQQHLPLFYPHFESETDDLSEESDTFSYITQEFDTDSEISEDDPLEDIFSDMEMIQLYLDQRITAAAA